MYANQLLLTKHQAVADTRTPLLPSLDWVNADGHPSPDALAAQALFNANCAVCHTLDGINDIRARLAGRTPDGVEVIIGLTEQLAPFMTPFTGTDEERHLLAGYLYTLANQDAARHNRIFPNLQPAEDK